MGQDSTDSEVRINWDYDDIVSEGFNALSSFEVVLINLGIITVDDVANIDDTESFDEKYSRKSEEPFFRRAFIVS